MVKNYISKLGLGTAQFGFDYSILNDKGKTPAQDVKSILGQAIDNGITTLDTAHLYGTSEKILGQTMNAEHSFDIVTKTIPVKKEEITTQDIKVVRAGFEISLQRLKKSSIYGILLHHADDLKSKNAELLYKYLLELKTEGKVRKIGVSVYDNEQIDYILDHFPIDLIQIPMNIFDQRLLQTGALKKLKAHNIEIHVRSAFLRGVIFMAPENLPPNLKRLSVSLTRFHTLVKSAKTTPGSAALAFLMQQKEIDKVICGVNNSEQFNTLIQNISILPEIENGLFLPLGVDDVHLVNPSHWNN